MSVELTARRAFAGREGPVVRGQRLTAEEPYARQLLRAGLVARGHATFPPRPPLILESRAIPRASGPWDGATAFVFAPGPSLTLDDTALCRGRGKAIVVNGAFPWAPWADVLYAADDRFWRTYAEDIEAGFAGERWSLSATACQRYGLKLATRGTGEGFCRRPFTINGGGNSGFQAVHLAATFGAARIVLLGFDMQRTNGREHCHGPHKGGLPSGKGFASWIGRFRYLARDLEALGVDNCTRSTALHCFPERRLEDVLDGL
jgi:hypothetical protein